MVKLRLARFGKKGAPTYRIVAIQARTKRQGKALDYLGHYNPRTQPSTIKIDAEKAQKWLDQGAQPTDTVRALFVKEGILKSEYQKKEEKKKKKPAKKATTKKTKSTAKKASK